MTVRTYTTPAGAVPGSLTGLPGWSTSIVGWDGSDTVHPAPPWISIDYSSFGANTFLYANTRSQTGQLWPRPRL